MILHVLPTVPKMRLTPRWFVAAILCAVLPGCQNLGTPRVHSTTETRLVDSQPVWTSADAPGTPRERDEVILVSAVDESEPPAVRRKRVVPPSPDGDDDLPEGWLETEPRELPPPSDRGLESWLLADGQPELAEDELLLHGLRRSEQEGASFAGAPIDWEQFDPGLEFETDPIFTFRDDLHDLVPNFVKDVKSLFTWKNGVILGVGAGVALGLRENVDGEVRAWTAEHPERWGEGSEVLREFGEYTWQIPALLGGYTWSLWRQDGKFHDFITSTISSYTLTSISTVALKGMTDTSRPSDNFENGQYGFPSFHASSTFAIAANIDTFYGWQAGLPAYALAGLVGWSRIDQREHDLSDVVFGSILGYTIGKSVSLSRCERSRYWRVDPWYDPAQQTAGLSFDLKY